MGWFCVSCVGSYNNVQLRGHDKRWSCPQPPAQLSAQMRFPFVSCITLPHSTVGILTRRDYRAEAVVRVLLQETPEQWPDCVLGNFMNCSEADKVSEYFWKCGRFSPAAVRKDEAGLYRKYVSRAILGRVRAQLGQSLTVTTNISTEKRHFWASSAFLFLEAK